MHLAGTTFYNGGGCILDSSSELDASVASRVNLLESFYYVADWQTSNLHRFKRFLLDSGAFTALYGAGMSADDLPKYVDDYIAYIIENDVRDFFEMDVDAIVGYRRVLEFRDEIERQTGRRCIPVWHLERGKDEFLKMIGEEGTKAPEGGQLTFL